MKFTYLSKWDIVWTFQNGKLPWNSIATSKKKSVTTKEHSLVIHSIEYHNNGSYVCHSIEDNFNRFKSQGILIVNGMTNLKHTFIHIYWGKIEVESP